MASRLVDYLKLIRTIVVDASGTIISSGAIPLRTGASSQITVTNVDAIYSAANSARRYLLIQNNDATQTIYLSFGAPATALNGIRILPASGYFQDTGIVSSQDIHLLSSGAANANVILIDG